MPNHQLWPCEDSVPPLRSNDIHVWSIDLDSTGSAGAWLAGIVSPPERQAAERKESRRDARHALVARGYLRAILSRYVGLPAAQLQFTYGKEGKPALVDYRGLERVQFNMAHCENMVLLAITQTEEVGVDLERIRDGVHIDEIARRYFSPLEQAALRIAAPENRLAIFFRCWTRKEAFLKARGVGLTYPLGDFTVSLNSTEPGIIQIAEDPQEAARWTLCDLMPSTTHVGALAIRQREVSVCCWTWVDTLAVNQVEC